MIVKFTKLFIDEWGSRVDMQGVVLIMLLEIEELFGEGLDTIVKTGLVFVVVFDDTQLTIRRIIVGLSK